MVQFKQQFFLSIKISKKKFKNRKKNCLMKSCALIHNSVLTTSKDMERKNIVGCACSVRFRKGQTTLGNRQFASSINKASLAKENKRNKKMDAVFSLMPTTDAISSTSSSNTTARVSYFVSPGETRTFCHWIIQRWNLLLSVYLNSEPGCIFSRDLFRHEPTGIFLIMFIVLDIQILIPDI